MANQNYWQELFQETKAARDSALKYLTATCEGKPDVRAKVILDTLVQAGQTK